MKSFQFFGLNLFVLVFFKIDYNGVDQVKKKRNKPCKSKIELEGGYVFTKRIVVYMHTHQ